MTEKGAPFDGILTGDAANAPYDSAEWAAIWRDLVRGSKADSGPLMGTGVSPDPGLTVSATGPASASVNVSSGSALVRGTWYNNSATLNLAIGANASGQPRIDTVILRKNFVAQTVRLVVVPGTPAGSPVPPVLTQADGGIWEIPLADIAVANGFATITAANITPRRNWANVADGVYLLDVLNNSGGTLKTGDVVVWDATADRAVTTTTTLGAANVAGVWVGRTVAGGYGRVLTHGIGYVNCGVVAARLTPLITYTTPGRAIAVVGVDSPSVNSIGIALQTTAAIGLCLAMIDVDTKRLPQVVEVTSFLGDGFTNSTVWQDVAADTLVIVNLQTGRVRITASLQGSFYALAASDTAGFDIYSDTLASRKGGTFGLAAFSTQNTAETHPVTIVTIYTGLARGVNHTFRVQHKVFAALSGLATGLVSIYAEEI